MWSSNFVFSHTAASSVTVFSPFPKIPCSMIRKVTSEVKDTFVLIFFSNKNTCNLKEKKNIFLIYWLICEAVWLLQFVLRNVLIQPLG